jgi:2-keto-4-pentenoate hydratase
MSSDQVHEAAKLLREAAETCIACRPIHDLIGASDLDAAYAVQSVNTDRALAAGRRIVGRKIGLTNPAVQAQLGVDQPDFGALFADMAVNDDEPVELRALISPRAEAEVAFVLDADLTEPLSTAADVVRATAFVLPAIEIVDSRVRDWDITIADTVADNASSGRFVLGTTPKALQNVDVRAVTMSMVLDGHEVSAGDGSACLGNPVNAVVWLANELTRRGDPLRAGDVVLSGALGPMASVNAPGRYEALIPSLGSVRARFV